MIIERVCGFPYRTSDLELRTSKKTVSHCVRNDIVCVAGTEAGHYVQMRQLNCHSEANAEV